jgi:hypothetical protein
MDREPRSRTAGCCDRTYWAWKFVDFPGARFQEALCVLSFLYATDGPGNRQYRHPRLLEWIGAGLRFWSRIQYADGSFDEAYPFERSLAATAFTSFYIGEALGFLGSDLPDDVRRSALETLKRAGRWLGANDESHGFLSNHLAAAAAALYQIGRLTGDPAFTARSRYFRDRILSRQSGEGWYDEYGGADPGYQTHGSFYLARLSQLSGDGELAASLARSTAWLACFIHPDGSIGGEYTSRNTQTYYPAAFEMLSNSDPSAAWIARTMRASVWSGAAAGPRTVDIYNYFPMLNNLVFAWLAAAKRQSASPAAESPPPDHELLWFPEAGFARILRGRYAAFVGTAKGGVIKVFDRTSGSVVFRDSGYLGETDRGQGCSTQYQDVKRSVRVSASRIEVEGGLATFSRPTMTPVRFLGFRLFSLTIGRAASVGRWLKHHLVKVLVYRRRPLQVSFRRSIDFQQDGIIITDDFHGAGGLTLRYLRSTGEFTTIHMGSSRYFINNALDQMSPAAAGAVEVDPRQIPTGVQVTRRIPVLEGSS